MKKYILGLCLVLFLVISCQPLVPEIEPVAEAEAEDVEAETSPTAAVVSEREPVIVLEEVAILGKEGFDPAELKITKGSQVVFINTGSKSVVIDFQHPTSRKVTNSDLIPPAESYTHFFAEAGTYDYWTTGYGVKGKIIVE